MYGRRVDEAFRTLADGFPQIIWSIATDGSVEWLNERWYAYTGDRRDERDPGTLIDFVHPDDVADVTAGWQAAMARGETYGFEYRLRGADGRYRWHYAQTSPLRGEDGATVRWYGISTDIHAVRVAEGSVDAVLESLPEIVWVADGTGSVVRVNDAFTAFTGVAREALLGTGWIDVTHPDDLSEALSARARGIDGGQTQQWLARLRRHDETYRWHLQRASAIRDGEGQITAWVATATDVDDQVRGNASLRELADTVPQFLCRTAADGHIVYANAQFHAYVGMPPESRPTWADVVHPHDLAQARAINDPANHPQAPVEMELRVRRHDGAYRWFLFRISLGHDASVNERAWYTSALDIHERKRVAESLQYLDEASDVFSTARELSSALGSAARLAVPRVADWCAIYLLQDDGYFTPSVIHHDDPSKVDLANELVRRYPFTATESAAMMEGREPVFMPEIAEESLRAGARDPRHAAMLVALDIASAIVVPLVVDDRAIGMLHLVRGRDNDRFTRTDVDFAKVLGKRIAVAVENARLFERERNVAQTFQNAALPRALPRVPGVVLDTVYVAGRSEAEIGGDWYDALAMPDGSLVVSIGDVAGKGLEAAVLMASMRQAIRVAAIQGLDPAAVLDVAHRALLAEQFGRFVTAFVARLDADATRLVYASAGHPPPILCDSGGVRQLELGGAPLGVEHDVPPLHEVTLAGDVFLAMYTDGLIETTPDILGAERELLRIVGSPTLRHSARPARFIRDRALAGGGVRDDTAILTLRQDRQPHWRYHADDALRAEATRRDFIAWLRERAEGDLPAAEVIYGELIGNVVRHQPGPIDVDVEQDETGFTLYVQDTGGAIDVSRAALPADTLSESGRGLFIIQALSGNQVTSTMIPGFGHEMAVRLPVRPR